MCSKGAGLQEKVGINYLQSTRCHQTGSTEETQVSTWIARQESQVKTLTNWTYASLSIKDEEINFFPLREGECQGKVR